MAFRQITPPAKALAGKQYGVDLDTGLLCITNPTYMDIIACKGVLVRYKSTGGTYQMPNVLLLMGRAFSEWVKILEAGGSVFAGPKTAEEYGMYLVKHMIAAKIMATGIPGRNNHSITNGVESVYLYAYRNVVLESVSAVPNTLLSGFWSTFQIPPSGNCVAKADASYVTMNNGNLDYYVTPAPMVGENASSGTNTADIGFMYGREENCGGGLPTDTNTNGCRNWGLPTYVAASSTSLTYQECVDKVVASVNVDDDAVLIALKSELTKALIARGAVMNQYMIQPLVFGGFAGTLRLVGDAAWMGGSSFYQPFRNRVADTLNNQFTDTSHVVQGGLVPVGNTKLLLPTMLVGQAVAPFASVWRVTSYANYTFQPPVGWDAITQAVGSTINGTDIRKVLGPQPFGEFYNDDLTPKVLPAVNFDMNALMQKMMSMTRSSDHPDPTAGYIASTGNSVESQRLNFFNDARGTDLGAIEQSSIADTYALTPRQIIAACTDSLVFGESDITVQPAFISRVLDLYPYPVVTGRTGGGVSVRPVRGA